MNIWRFRIPLNGLQLFQLIRFGATLFIGILLAKIFQLSTGSIAIYEILLFLGNFFSFFWLSAGVKTLLTEFGKSNNQFSLLVNLALILLGLGVLAAGILYIFQKTITQYLTQYEQLDHLPFICGYLIFNAPAVLIEYIYLLSKQEKSIVQYGIWVFGGQLLAIILPLLFDWGLNGIFRCLLIWSFLKFLWLIKLVGSFKGKKNLHINWGLQKRLLWLMLPLSLHMLVGGGMEYIDGFIVSSYFTNTDQFAIFRYGARELPLVTILTSALAATIIPLAVDNQQLALSKIKSEINKLSNWLFPITGILMLLSPYFFPLIYNQDFAPSATVFNIYLLIISSRILLPQVIIYAKQDNYFLVYSAIIEIIVNLELSLYLVQYYGLAGIAFATVIAYCLNKVVLMTFLYFKYQIRPSDYLPLPKYCLSIVLLSITYCLSLYLSA